MTQPIHLIGDVYAVEVPEGATAIEICNYGLNDALEFVHKIEGIAAYDCNDLPPGSWQVIGTVKEALKKVPMGIVECKIVEYDGGIKGTRFVNYLNDNQRTWFINKTDSFRSLLTSKGLAMEKNWVLIKKTS
jgi:hypothetical protein